MPKVQLLPGTAGTYSFFCPGCGTWHTVHTKNEGFEHPIWEFNGDVDRPTFSPSLLAVHYIGLVPAEENKSHWKGQRELRCHSFIRNGRIEYLQDCDHGLAGQTVDMVDLPMECPRILLIMAKKVTATTKPQYTCKDCKHSTDWHNRGADGSMIFCRCQFHQFCKFLNQDYCDNFKKR